MSLCMQLSFSSDVWSLGCILYQMIYGSPPFQGVTGGPLVKMQVIGSGTFDIPYPASVTAARKHSEEPASPGAAPVVIPSEAIDTIQSCLAHRREDRLAIPALLEHVFLKPKPGGCELHLREHDMVLHQRLIDNVAQLHHHPSGCHQTGVRSQSKI